MMTGRATEPEIRTWASCERQATERYRRIIARLKEEARLTRDELADFTREPLLTFGRAEPALLEARRRANAPSGEAALEAS